MLKPNFKSASPVREARIETQRPNAILSLLLALVAGIGLHLPATTRGAVITNVNGTLSVTNPVASVTLAWDLESDTNVIGYHLFWGIASRTYTNYVTVTGTNFCTVSPLVRGTTYYFAVTAFTTNLESVYSSEVSYTPQSLPVPPNNARTAYFTLLNSPDLNQWCDLADFALPVADTSGFYRVRIGPLQ